MGTELSTALVVTAAFLGLMGFVASSEFFTCYSDEMCVRHAKIFSTQPGCTFQTLCYTFPYSHCHIQTLIT